MSRIGKLPIDLPKTVMASVHEGVITVEGPKGKLSQKISDGINVQIEESRIVVTRECDEKEVRAAHGLMRQLIHNMIIGVSNGYAKTLLIVGVGYKAEMQGKNLVLSLGFANDIEFVVPQGVTIACDGPTKITVSGIDKQLVGQTAAEIRSLRKPEPYKGKGIKYDYEHVRSKSGKAGRA